MAEKKDLLHDLMDGRGREFTKIYRARYNGLDQERSSYIPLWRDMRDFLAPRTARFKGELINDATRQDLNIINTSPRFAVRILGAGMQSGVTSPMRPWFRLGTADPDMRQNKRIKEWLFDVERILREIMSRSNIYDRLKSTYSLQGVYGIASLFLDQDDDDIIRGHDFPMGTFMVATSAAGRCNAAYRDVSMTAAQMMAKFKGRAPEMAKLAYDRGDYETRFDVCHIVEENRIYKERSAYAAHKRFSSIWLDRSKPEDDAILGWEGYDYNPVFSPRWDVYGEEVYGSGCGEYALGDAKQLQLLEKRSLQILDKVAHPTMVGDASLKTQRTTNMPGETTYVNGLITGNQGYRPAYQIQRPPIDIVDAKSMRVEARIDEAFYKNLFLLVTELADQPNITATQINTMREEKLLMLGPVLERLNDELLDPLIDVIFNIAQSRGLLPPPPEELQGMPLKVEYISVLAQAQRAMGIGNIERFVGFVGNLALIDPRAPNKLNTNEIIDEYGDGIAIPPRLIRTNDEVSEIDQQQQQQAAAAQMAEIGPPMAKAAKDLSQTEWDQSNALTNALQGATVNG